jgi:hypothetical protein
MLHRTRKKKPSIRRLKLGQDGSDFDLAFWGRLGANARFAKAWELAMLPFLMRGMKPHELRLQRSIVALKRLPR